MARGRLTEVIVASSQKKMVANPRHMTVGVAAVAVLFLCAARLQVVQKLIFLIVCSANLIFGFLQITSRQQQTNSLLMPERFQKKSASAILPESSPMGTNQGKYPC